MLIHSISYINMIWVIMTPWRALTCSWQTCWRWPCAPLTRHSGCSWPTCGGTPCGWERDWTPATCRQVVRQRPPRTAGGMKTSCLDCGSCWRSCNCYSFKCGLETDNSYIPFSPWWGLYTLSPSLNTAEECWTSPTHGWMSLQPSIKVTSINLLFEGILIV